MCGIFGAISSGRRFDEKDFAQFVRQTDMVSYRGPDAAGYRVFDNDPAQIATSSSFETFIGHRRLSIIDLSENGRQPMSDGLGRWIVFNGEVFNYLELREELKRLGHVFKTETDTEVILRLYDHYGLAGFGRMNGMWAFALVDLQKRVILLSRDRFSVKPLYYTAKNGRFYFGSEIKQLLTFIGASINRNVMHTFLAQGIADHTNQTFFDGVFSVKPKHTLVIDLTNGKMCEHQYWEYDLSHEVKPHDAIEAFRELLIDSVQLRLRSDLPLGVLVSGGLDSSTIAVVIAKILKIPVETYSVVSRQPEFSEGRFVDALVREGMSNRRIVLDTKSSLQDIDKAIYHNDEPFLGLHAVAQFKVLDAIRKQTQVRVLLSGQGGDECLLGYSKFFFFHLAELLQKGHLARAVREFWCSLWLGTTVRNFRISAAKRYLPRGIRRDSPSFLRTGTDLEAIGAAETIRKRQMLDLDRYSVPVQTHLEDRMSMAHALEVRTPFLDYRLVELALRLPTSLKLSAGWTKYVLRAGFPELPQAIRWRRDKKGFVTPEELWMRTTYRRTLGKMFSGSTLQDLGILDDNLFLKCYSRFLGRRNFISYCDISRVMVAERWARIFMRGEAITPQKSEQMLHAPSQESRFPR
jgi:asparagine synthase (glutamine-hydrolysing)